MLLKRVRIDEPQCLIHTCCSEDGATVHRRDSKFQHSDGDHPLEAVRANQAKNMESSTPAAGWKNRARRTGRDPRHARGEEPGSEGDLSFGNTELIAELNSLVTAFTVQQKELLDSTGFGAFVNAGKKVWDSSLPNSQRAQDYVRQIIGARSGNEPASVAALRRLRGLAGRMNPEDEDAFKVSWVVYVVSMHIDTKSISEAESCNYFPALTHSSILHTFDWAFYVLEEITLSVWQVMVDAKNRRPARPNLAAALFLQVFYLDNMDYGEESPAAGSAPPIHDFTSDVVGRLIMADTVGLVGANPTREFGKGKLKPASCVIYRRTKDNIVPCIDVTIRRNPKRDSVTIWSLSRTKKAKALSTPPAQEHVNKPCSRGSPANSPEIVETEGIHGVDARVMVAVKRFKAKCLKHIMAAKKQIDVWIRHETNLEMRPVNDKLRALAEENFTLSRSIRRQFIGDHIPYELWRCQLVLTVVEFETNWISIAWDMKRKQTTVFIPVPPPAVTPTRWAAYEKLVSVLHDALGTCFLTFFDDFVSGWSAWPKVFIEPPKKRADSGVMALQFCRNFDGICFKDLATHNSATTNDRVELLYDLMHLRPNRGVLPPEFVESIL
ncbi:hypothetical protein ACP70R_033039 [Stipagrostis hirtigluma subsp. patula]